MIYDFRFKKYTAPKFIKKVHNMITNIDGKTYKSIKDFYKVIHEQNQRIISKMNEIFSYLRGGTDSLWISEELLWCVALSGTWSLNEI